MSKIVNRYRKVKLYIKLPVPVNIRLYLFRHIALT
jgi:hypothetical protein